MAGSRRSPVLRDQWNGDPDREPRDRDRRRGRGSNRDRGRQRYRDRGGRHSRPNDRHFDYRARSPPARASRFGPDSSHDSADYPLDRSPPPRGSPGPVGFHENRRSDNPRPSSSTDWNTNPSRSADNKESQGFRRDESPFPPSSKRKRTRSPSPRGQRGHFSHRRPSFASHGERRDRSPSYKSRGRFPGRGAGRRRSPRRGRDRRGKDNRHSDIPRPDKSRSPVRDRGFHPSPDRRSRSPSAGYSDRDSRYRSRSLSRHSGRSIGSRASVFSFQSRGDDGISSNRPVDNGGRSPMHRRVTSFDGSNMSGPSDGPANIRDDFSTHGKPASDDHKKQHRGSSRPHAGIGSYSTSPRFGSPTGSHHGSPFPPSPYSGGGRGGRNGPPSYSGSIRSPYRQDDFFSQNTSQGHHKNPPSHPHSPYNGPSRGGHHPYRANQASSGTGRRFSGSGASSFNNGHASRVGRGHFNNLQWTASGSRGGRSGQQSPRPGHNRGSRTPTREASIDDARSPRAMESEDDFRPSSRDRFQKDGNAPPTSEEAHVSDMAPPAREVKESTPAQKGGKFSFTFKAKTTPTTTPKPVPDLAQRMQIREPPSRVPAPDPPTPRNRLTNGPMPKFQPEPRQDRRDRDRGGRDRERDWDRREFRDQRDPREFRDHRDQRDQRDRKDERRFENRRDRRKNERNERRADFRQDRHRDRTPEPPKEQPPKQKKILTRPKPRPTLPEEFADADSVYYRKPGNESVIGAGTYGKVFKGIHVYTQRKVALKKIRMEGEKDGFPVTAVREIKLLQHLRNHNVVSLLEVMVERNECFMVFEYLSHDLTGLINHPTFSLTLAHKKDLAKQMFEGLNYLHHRGVLHRDIKAANILISNQGLLKFADFGLARFFSKSRQLDYTNRVITIWYRPPELLLGETRYGPAVDVWSAACVCIEMFTKKAAFPGDGGELSQLDKLYNSLGTPTKGDWPDLVEMPWFQLMRPSERKKRVFEDQYRDILTPAALDLISQVFRYDPAKRPSAEELLQHPYFVSEEPAPQQALELEHIEGDWHEFESKALRKEARRAEYQSQKDREKRKAEASVPPSDRDRKRARGEGTDQTA
ncbi:hypothetical protein N7462_003657 [Penicillium macrosclerotiorum]|uniref:uncharacterized protein n=1 Tax=Penicillium macrosclerotiorum TaxID=303699 RepID=UPI0025476775|nr:uncharacterized protein N7462_003657 [Penicillium macrosclerotiorum]KAJ5689265.1 hypothetical protein N7462_003657 [Penicillium macrosclerotiorum]